MNIFSLLALVTAADLFPYFLSVSIASLVAFVTVFVWPKKKSNDQPQQTQTSEPKQVAEPFKPEILVGPDKQHVISGAVEQPVEEPVVETVVEPVVEPAPVEQPQTVVATVAKAENETDQGVMILEGKEVLVRYKRSFESKLMQSTEELKGYYAEFVNHALSYKKVKVKLSWPCAKISRSRDKIATLLVKGKTMYVYLALDPEIARQTIKGKIKDVSNKKRFQDVPTLFKVKSPLSLRKAKTLLDKVMETLAIDYVAPSSAISAETYPYDTTENLIKQGLIRVRTLDGSPIEDGDILRTAGFILGNPAKQQPVEVEQPQPEPVVEVQPEVESDEGVMYIDDNEVLVRYNRSFTSKLMQASDLLKAHYAELTNHALSYKKVKLRVSWPCAKLNYGRDNLAIITIRGKSLYLYLDMDPEVARQTIKGTIKDVSDKKRYQQTPTLFKIKSGLALKRAKTLINAMMQAKGIEFAEVATDISAEQFPYDTTENLIKAGLIKVRALDGREIEEGMILRAAGFRVGSIAPAQPAPAGEQQLVEVPAGQEADSDDGIMLVDEQEILVRYNRSFTSKLMQASDLLKGHYSELANHALSHKKVKLRISWPCAKLNHGRENIITFTVRGKTLYMYLAMDPESARQVTKGTIKDVSDKKRYQATPSLFKIKSALALKRAKVLIDALMQQKGIAYVAPCADVSAENYPYDTTENLVKAGLIKVRTLDGREVEQDMILRAAGFKVVESVTAEEAHTMISDEVASTLVVVEEDPTPALAKDVEIKSLGSRSGRKFAINIDTLSKHFQKGDRVTIDVLKQKGLVPKKETAIKVLARGTLDKPLIVEAAAFSLDAIKMIVLVGGTAIRK